MVAVFAGSYLILLLARMLLACLGARRAKKLESSTAAVPVSILQPILSGDPLLEAILADNVRGLPWAHFFWLVDTDDFTAQSIAQRIQEAHPQASIRVIFCPPVPRATNPKVFKLALAERLVETPHLVVLDDDTRLPAKTLLALQVALSSTFLATGLPVYRPAHSAPSRLVEQFVNNESLLTYLSWSVLSRPLTLNGMIYALRTKDWLACGGFAPLQRHLTDDVAVARAALNAGHRIHQSAQVVEVATTLRDFPHYCSLMHRWFLFADLLFSLQPHPKRGILAIFLALPSALLWALLFSVALAPTTHSGILLFSTLVLRSLLLGTLQRILSGRWRHQPAYSILAELAQPFHVVHARMKRTLLWRGRRIRVRDEANFDFL